MAVLDLSTKQTICLKFFFHFEYLLFQILGSLPMLKLISQYLHKLNVQSLWTETDFSYSTRRNSNYDLISYLFNKKGYPG